MRLKFLLRPAWIALILLVVVFSSICFTVLAPWQFHRSEQAQARNAAIQRSLHSTPRPLSTVLPQGRAPGPATEWTQVSMRGRYLPEAETLGWLRTVQGEAAIEVLTPFQLANGSIVLVNRGYVRPAEEMRAPPYAPAPTGVSTITARVRSDESDSEHRPVFQHDGHRWSYAVDSRTVARATGLPIRPGYFALTGDQPGVLAPLPLPQLESGPYFSYALQWIAFGVMAPMALLYLVRAELRPAVLPSRNTTSETTETSSKRRKMSVGEAVAEDERREQEERAAHENQ